MHGRERFANTVSSQVRSWNTFCRMRDAFAHRARARERPEIAVRPIERAAMEAQLRIRVAAEADVRIALVVAVEDVVARLLAP